jgi:hypothetical protein
VRRRRVEERSGIIEVASRIEDRSRWTETIEVEAMARLRW